MKEVRLPELFEDMERAIISYWHLEEGDPVEEGDNLVEITVNNETHNVPCPYSGILNEVFFEEGDEVEVGEIIATIEDERDDDFAFGNEDESEEEM